MKNDHSTESDTGGRPDQGASARTWQFVVRRQMYIYLAMIAAGIHYIVQSGLEKMHLISEGASFIMVGLVGLIMSTTMSGIGNSIRSAVLEEGEKTRNVTREEGEKTRNVTREEGEKTRNVTREEGEKTRGEIVRVATAVEAMSSDNREFYRQMLDVQRRILEKMS